MSQARNHLGLAVPAPRERVGAGSVRGEVARHDGAAVRGGSPGGLDEVFGKVSCDAEADVPSYLGISAVCVVEPAVDTKSAPIGTELVAGAIKVVGWVKEADLTRPRSWALPKAPAMLLPSQCLKVPVYGVDGEAVAIGVVWYG